MMLRRYLISLVTILLAACGDGGSHPTASTDASVSGKDAEMTRQAADLSMEAPMSGAQAAAATPTSHAKHAEGTYILGSMARRAIETGSAAYHAASELPPGTDTIWLRSDVQAHDWLATWTMDTIPRPEDCIKCLPNVRSYPASKVVFPLHAGRNGSLSLGSFIYARHGAAQDTQGEARQLLKRDEGSFRIHDHFKYPLNATIAQWRGLSQAEDFVQLQLATYPLSDAVFKLCLHQSLGEVRRLTCTLHDRQTAARVGVQAFDDSTGTGPVEFRSILPPQP